MSRRLAAVVVRFRVLVVVAWFALAAACVLALPDLREAQSGGLGDLVPVDARAIDAERRSAELFAFPLISRTHVVQRDPEGLSPALARATAERVLQVNRGEIPGLRAIAGAYPVANVLGPPAFALEDDTTVVVPLLFRPDVSLTESTELGQGLVQRLEPVAGGAFQGVTGIVPARVAQGDLIAEHLPTVELATLVFVLFAVGIYTRSLVAPFATLVAVALAYIVSIRVVAAGGQALGVSVPSEVEPVVVALLFGVVTDYVLFSVSRFRRKLDEGLEPRVAAESAAAELTPILTACGLAVAGGCGALIIAQLGFLRAFGPGVALSVLVALAVALTFVPACTALLGRKLLWPSARGPRTARTTSRSERRLRRVVRRPKTAIALSLAVLLALASGTLWIELGQPIIRGLPDDHPANRAYDQAAAGLAPGVLSPVVIVVEGRGVVREREALAGLQEVLTNQPGVAAVVGPASNPLDVDVGAIVARNGDAARYVLYLSDDPLGGRAVRRLRNLSARLDGLLDLVGLPDASAGVAGDTALVAETIEEAASDVPRVLPVVLAAVALVLIVLLRALVAPLYLVAVALLPPLAATGLAVGVFQGLLGQEELTYFAPIAAGVLLVALGSDYNVFLVGRIWTEARDRPLTDAVVSAGAGAARAISAAAIVLAASFAAIALVPIAAFRELAFLVAAGLLIDAFLVRSVLVPAIIALVGERSAWPGRALRAPVDQQDATPVTVAASG